MVPPALQITLMNVGAWTCCFFEDNSNVFPIMWIISQCEMSNQVVEVDCEHFFKISGYVSSENRTRLKVRIYV